LLAARAYRYRIALLCAVCRCAYIWTTACRMCRMPHASPVELPSAAAAALMSGCLPCGRVPRVAATRALPGAELSRTTVKRRRRVFYACRPAASGPSAQRRTPTRHARPAPAQPPPAQRVAPALPRPQRAQWSVAQRVRNSSNVPSSAAAHTRSARQAPQRVERERGGALTGHWTGFHWVLGTGSASLLWAAGCWALAGGPLRSGWPL
jgi:hypothetical protein